MKNRRIKQLFSIFFLFLVSFQIISCNGGNNDAAIQAKILSITQTTPELENVSASVSKGVVTLIGRSKNEKERERAEKAIKNIDEVKAVINNITVTEDLIVASDNELRDQSLKAIKKFKHVQADINNGIITLRGTIDKDDLQELITNLNELKPKRIENQLVVE